MKTCGKRKITGTNRFKKFAITSQKVLQCLAEKLKLLAGDLLDSLSEYISGRISGRGGRKSDG